MWHDWSEDSVRKDLMVLAKQGIRSLRVFPLWSDFQPLTRLCGGGNFSAELRLGEEPLPDTEDGRAGVNPVMLERFRVFAQIAEENHLSLIVGLVTGWMSGRCFTPPAFVGKNLLSDPEVIRWEVRFVRRFVRVMRDCPAIGAWDLGNECNCMEPVPNPDTAWLWTNSIASAIRQEDATRPVVSGVHSIAVDSHARWNLADQGELTDVLTTRPYPLFTPFCSQAPINEPPGTLHASAESVLYHDLGGKPCIVEEAGTLGPMTASDERSAEYLRSALAAAWANDLRDFLWWCAFDLDRPAMAPYDWVAIERELGLMTSDRRPKAAMRTMADFARRIAKLPIDRLPPRQIDCVCLLPETPSAWKIAFGAFLLAQEAGVTLRFTRINDPL